MLTLWKYLDTIEGTPMAAMMGLFSLHEGGIAWYWSFGDTFQMSWLDERDGISCSCLYVHWNLEAK